MLTFFAVLFTSCEKDNDDVIIKPETPIASIHTHFTNSANGTIHQFNYVLDNNLKSSLLDTATAIRFIRVTSYYSKDAGQRNIHEIEVYSDSVNIAYKYGKYSTANPDSILTFSSNRASSSDEQPMNVTDSNFTMYGRWAANRPSDDVLHKIVEDFTTKFDSILANTRDTVKLDSIITNTVYPDTVWLTIDLRNVYSIENIKLYLGQWTQVFDVEISKDGENWTLLKPDEIEVVQDSK
jgi:hypothetical protein